SGPGVCAAGNREGAARWRLQHTAVAVGWLMHVRLAARSSADRRRLGRRLSCCARHQGPSPGDDTQRSHSKKHTEQHEVIWLSLLHVVIQKEVRGKKPQGVNPGFVQATPVRKAQITRKSPEGGQSHGQQNASTDNVECEIKPT